MMVVMVMAAVRVEVVISSYQLNCMFCGGICGVGSDSGINSGSGGSSIAHNCHHYYHHYR